MLGSYAFSFKTFVYSKKIAINFVFICLLYKGRVSVIYGVFYVTTFCTFTTFS